MGSAEFPMPRMERARRLRVLVFGVQTPGAARECTEQAQRVTESLAMPTTAYMGNPPAKVVPVSGERTPAAVPASAGPVPRGTEFSAPDTTASTAGPAVREEPACGAKTPAVEWES